MFTYRQDNLAMGRGSCNITQDITRLRVHAPPATSRPRGAAAVCITCEVDEEWRTDSKAADDRDAADPAAALTNGIDVTFLE